MCPRSKSVTHVFDRLSTSVLQGRHVKTGQLAAIKVMDVTGVSDTHCL